MLLHKLLIVIGSACAGITHFLALGEHGIDQPVFLCRLGAHEIIALQVLFDPLDALAGVF